MIRNLPLDAVRAACGHLGRAAFSSPVLCCLLGHLLPLAAAGLRLIQGIMVRNSVFKWSIFAVLISVVFLFFVSRLVLLVCFVAVSVFFRLTPSWLPPGRQPMAPAYFLLLLQNKTDEPERQGHRTAKTNKKQTNSAFFPSNAFMASARKKNKRIQLAHNRHNKTRGYRQVTALHDNYNSSFCCD